MTLSQLRYFVAVAEEMHFGRAAARLGIAQPSLSQQIRALERSIGMPLFRRVGRRVELAPAGAALLDRARGLLTDATRASDAARRAGAGERVLRIGFIGPAVGRLLPDALALLRRREPDLRIVLKEMTTPRVIDALVSGALDVGLVRGPVFAEGIRVDPVTRHGLVAVLPAGHPLAHRPRIAPAELRGEGFVMFPRRGAVAIYDAVLATCRDAGFVPRIAAEVSGWASILMMVAAGYGVSLLASTVTAFRYDGTTYRPLREISIQPELGLARRADVRSDDLTAFASALREAAR